MSIVIGSLLGIGFALMVAPLLWPERRTSKAGPSKVQSRLRSWLNAAGFSTIPVPFFITFSIMFGICAAATTHALLGVVGLTTAVLCAGMVAPGVLVRWRSAMRARVNRNIWPDIVDHIVSAVRSGLALPDSLILLARSGPEITRWAFREFEHDYAATGNFHTAVHDLKSRLADPAADRILETIAMAREVGGTELTTVLRSLGSYLRAELALRHEVEARQSWVHNAAKLGVAAPWIVLLVLSARPEAQLAYNSPVGVIMIVVGFAVSVVAYRVMLRIGRMPNDARWFA